MVDEVLWILALVLITTCHGFEATTVDAFSSGNFNISDMDVLPTPIEWGDNPMGERSGGYTDNDISPIKRGSEQFLEECSDHIEVMKATCDNRGYTCQNRCGEVLTKADLGIEESFSPKKPCQCDKACMIYEDCCPNFRSECPQELADFERNLTHLSTAQKMCSESGYQMIMTCPTQSAPAGDQYVDTADKSTFEDVPVVDMTTGVTYSNYTVFKCNARRGSKPKFWGKQLSEFLASEITNQMNDIQLRYTDGYLKGSNYPLPDLPVRACTEEIRFNCYRATRSLDCSFTTATNGWDFCRNIYEYVKNTGMATTPAGSEIPDSGEMAKSCDVRDVFIKTRSFMFSMTMSINEDDNSLVLSSTPSSEVSWMQMSCRPKEDDFSHSCSYIKCKESFFLCQKECLKPTSMLITFLFRGVSSEALARLLEMLDNIIQDLQSNLVMQSDGGFIEEDNGKYIYIDSYRIISNTLTDDDEQLPPSAALRQMLEDVPPETLQTFPSRIQICFTFAPQTVVTGSESSGGSDVVVGRRCDLFDTTGPKLRTVSITSENLSLLQEISDNGLNGTDALRPGCPNNENCASLMEEESAGHSNRNDVFVILGNAFAFLMATKFARRPLK